jgi:hypothetical protein
MGFSDFSLEVDAEHGHGSLFLHENADLIKENLPRLVEDFNHLLQLISRKEGIDKPFFLDINHYRKEREHLIAELARASARRVSITKQSVSLPVMNSYERRIAHMELAAHPDVATESVGKGHGRYVVVKPVGEVTPPPSPASAV